MEGKPGAWQAEGLLLPLAGRWPFHKDIKRTRFNLVKLGADIDIK